MLQRFRFTLKCLQAGRVRGMGGGEVHGLLFSLLGEAGKERAEGLHKTSKKPFSLSPLQGIGKRHNGFFYLQPGEIYSFTVASLTEEMHHQLEEVVARWSPREVELGTALLATQDVGPEIPGGITYQELVAKAQARHNTSLEFVTPTSFRQRGTQILFPQPEYVFGSLRQRWNDHGPIQLPLDLDLTQVRVTRHRIHTQVLHFKNYKIIGFTGRCSYQVSEKTPDFLPWLLSVLANFGEIAGVGYKTTMGMGVMRR